MELQPTDIRVLGSLIEKAMTTPDHYPLSLNALLAACNQRTNRDPVVDLADGDVIEAINTLRDRGLCRLVHTPGQRVVKYRHAVDAAFDLGPGDLALVAVLMLRGEQTPGELRARTPRYHQFTSPAEVEASLDDLARREPPLVERLDRRPGEKEARYRHLLGGEAPPAVITAGTSPHGGTEVASLAERVAALEAEVAELRAALRRVTEPD